MVESLDMMNTADPGKDAALMALERSLGVDGQGAAVSVQGSQGDAAPASDDTALIDDGWITDADYQRYLLKNPYQKGRRAGNRHPAPDGEDAGQSESSKPVRHARVAESVDADSGERENLKPARYARHKSPASHARPKSPAKPPMIAVLSLLVCVVGGCLLYDFLRPPDITDYADVGISIAGLEDKEFLVTPTELLDFESVSESVSGTGEGQAGESKAGTVRTYGPYLEIFVASHGHKLEDFSRIRVLCKDGYTVTLRPKLLEGKPILSVADYKDALPNYQRPLRLVIPGDATNKWSFGILRIEFVV